MIIRLIGAILIITGCGSVGFIIAMEHKKETKSLEQLLSAIEYIRCELAYRRTPLPGLFRLLSASTTGQIRTYFTSLYFCLKEQRSPDFSVCAKQTMASFTSVTPKTKEALNLLGDALGHYDVAGQIESLNAVYDQVKLIHSDCKNGQKERIRSYQTLALCAGASLAILLV